MTSAVIRPVLGSDLDALVGLEDQAFSGDRFSRRQLWHLIHRANAQTLVVAAEGRLLGYGTLLLRRNSHNARLYSLAIAPDARGFGYGRQLLEALEVLCRELDCRLLTLEVRADNRTALAMYRRCGFRLVRWLEDYYEDDCAAWRMHKALDEPLYKPLV